MTDTVAAKLDDPILAVERLVRSFGGIHAVDGATLSVARNSITPPSARSCTPDSACTALRVDAARVTVWSCPKSASRRVVIFMRLPPLASKSSEGIL